MNYIVLKKIANKTEYVFPYMEKYAHFQELRSQFYENIFFLKDSYFSYGGINADLLFDSYIVNGYNLERSAVSATFDQQLELLMPDVWYLNGGEHLINTPLYFNRVQLGKESNSKRQRQNSELAADFGYYGLIEFYFRDLLLERFVEENITAFSVIKTLPECARVLESDLYEDILKGGYENGRYRRLLPYIPSAMYYYHLMEENQAVIKDYNKDNFFLGMEKTQQIVEGEGNSPIRRYFVDLWKNVLSLKGIDPQHTEIIVLGTKFSYNRRPDLVLIGEHQDAEFQNKIIDSPFAYKKTRKIYVKYQEPEHSFDLIKRRGIGKWDWDPETYLLSLVLLNELGEETLYLKGLALYLSLVE